MQVGIAAGGTDAEGHDRKPRCVQLAEDLEVRFGLPCVDRSAQQPTLLFADRRNTYVLLELEDQAGAD